MNRVAMQLLVYRALLMIYDYDPGCLDQINRNTLPACALRLLDMAREAISALAAVSQSMCFTGAILDSKSFATYMSML